VHSAGLGRVTCAPRRSQPRAVMAMRPAAAAAVSVCPLLLPVGARLVSRPRRSVSGGEDGRECVRVYSKPRRLTKTQRPRASIDQALPAAAAGAAAGASPAAAAAAALSRHQPERMPGSRRLREEQEPTVCRDGPARTVCQERLSYISKHLAPGDTGTCLDVLLHFQF